MTVRACSARCGLAALAAGLATVWMFAAAPALAITQSPQWTVTSVSRPTNFRPGDQSGDDSYRVTVTNTGGVSSDGSAITITDELPEGLKLDHVGASGENVLAGEQGLSRHAGFSCVSTTCTYSGVVVPDETLDLTFPVDVSAEAPSQVTNMVHVSGGGALDASMSTPTDISPGEASFGVSPGGATTALSTTQAGAHPDLTTSIAFNTVDERGALAAAPKDTTDYLPAGFAGDLVDTPSCPVAEFSVRRCPVDTQIGVTTLSIEIQGHTSLVNLQPVYNLTPNPGELAKLGFTPGDIFGVQGNVSERPPGEAGEYGLKTSFENIPDAEDELDSVSLTIWGVPADPIHDPLRFNSHVSGGIGGFGIASEAALAPFFTNPTSCGTLPLEATFTVDSWEAPGENVGTQMPFGPLVGCDRLGMEPALTATATTNRAYAPTGLDFDTKIPQTYENPDGLATSTLKKEVVTLPEGMTVNPSSGAGLGACSEAQYAEEGVQQVPGHGCPNDSKLGTVRITTPAVKEEVTGSVFIAEPAPFGEAGKNPFGSLLALYVIARIPNRGVLVKAPGEVEPNPLTGRLVTTFDGLAPLPFSLLTFSFNQGANSPLVTPPTCGNYTVEAALTTWADPEGAALTPLIPPFPISTGAEGGACPSGAAPFAPQVIAGTQDNAAGSYSPIYLRVTRNDGEQEITGFSSQLPPGLTANLTGVPFCSEADIVLSRTKTGAQEEAEPSCPPASEIGHTLAGAGVGPILAEAPGKIYMAGPFKGAPFSVVSITSAKVGPFDLGTVVVHLPLDINPETAAVTIPAGPADQIPHIIKGIVIHVRDIRVYVDRHDFTLNPTNCAPMSFDATVIGSGKSFTSAADDEPVTLADPFQAANCQNLAFKPSFQVSTSGKTSKLGGASLSVKVSYPNAPLGTQANIKSVKVELPIQLPSRLTTLQKACTEQAFDTNPATCPAASIVGHATAITPILPVPLTGPAYFVSHGGVKFPELIIILQGYGVTIELHGETFISKAGITSSTFRTIPDQPVTSFELTLPQGPDSALATYGSLCAPTRLVAVRKRITGRSHGHTVHRVVTVKEMVPTTLRMPTAFTAQNGATLDQDTPVVVTGCPKPKHAKKKGKSATRAHSPKRIH